MSVQALTYVLGHRAGGDWVIPPLATPSSGARVVLLVIANIADENGEAYPAVETIAAAADMSTDQARRHLRALAAAELIEIINNAAPDRRIPHNRRPNLYRITGLASAPAHPKTDLAPTRLRPRVDAAQTSRPREPIPQQPPVTKTAGVRATTEPGYPTPATTLALLDDYRDTTDTPNPVAAIRSARNPNPDGAA